MWCKSVEGKNRAREILWRGGEEKDLLRRSHKVLKPIDSIETPKEGSGS